MDQWRLFAWIFDNFDTQFLAAVQGNANNLLAAVQTPLLLGVTVWLAGTSAVELYSPGTDPIFMLVRKAIRGALVLGMVGAASYTAVFETFVLTTLPNELTAAIAGAGNGGAGTPAAFDKLLNGGWVAVAMILKNVSGWAPSTIILAIIAVAEFVIGGIFIAIGFLVYIASHIMLGLAITIGPLFVCALLWDKSVYLFDAWIKTLLAQVVTQVLIVAMLSVLLLTETNILTQINALNAPSGHNANDIAGQVHYMIESALLYFMIGYLAPKIVELAQALTRGAAPGIAGLSQRAHGAMSSGAKAVGNAALSGAKSAGTALGRAGAAGMRSITPAGKAP
jgi:type IV secretion system protein VirB6